MKNMNIMKLKTVRISKVAVAIIAVTLLTLILQSCKKDDAIPVDELDDEEIVFDKIFNPTEEYFELIESEVDIEGAKTIKVNATEECEWYGMYPQGATAKEIHFDFSKDGKEASFAGVNNTGYIKGLDQPREALFIMGELESSKVVHEKGKVYLELKGKEGRDYTNTKAMIYLGETDKMTQEQIEASVTRIEENNLSIGEGA